jgi:hypothetical protein
VLALGTEMLFGTSDVRAAASDNIAVSSMVLLGGSASAMVRVLPALAIGLRGGGASELGARGYESSSGESGTFGRSLWQLAATARYQPAGGSAWYGSARAGVAAIIDSAGEDSVTQWGPLGGAALGYDFRITGAFLLGLELQGGLAVFAEEGARLPRKNGEYAAYIYGTSSWLGFGLVGSLGI